MCENLRIQEIGKLDHESFDLEVIRWKIPNVSSIPFAVDYGVQSPPISFAGASWILKIYFNGQTKCNSKGYIDVVAERIHSEIESHNLSWKIYCKNVYGREFHPINQIAHFASNHRNMNVLRIMENFRKRFDKWEIAPNDIFTLVCEVQNTKSIVEKKSIEKKANKISTVIKKAEESEIGSIDQTTYSIEAIKWTIRNASSLPSPEDCLVQSKPFSFANASWTLKMYPYFQIKRTNKQYFYMALARLHSKILDQYVGVNIRFEDRIKGAFDEVSRSFIFDPDHIQGDVICFTLREEQITAPNDIFTLFCKFKTRNNMKIELEFEPKLNKSGEAYRSISESLMMIQKVKVLRDYKELLLKQEDCDVTIVVKGCEFPAHKPILKARSPVLAAEFRSDMVEKTTGIINIEDCDPSHFSDFLQFLYCGEVEKLSAKNVFSLFKAADKYDICDLRTICIDFMKTNLSVDTFCDTITLALLHSEDELIKLSTDFFAKNLQEIILTVKWQSFLIENPIQGNELLIKAMEYYKFFGPGA